MKNKVHSSAKIFEYLTSRESYKVFFFLLILLCIFGRLQIAQNLSLDTAIIIPFSIPLYHYALLLIFIYNTITTCKIFDDNFDELFIRYKTKKNKIKIIMKNVILITIYSLLLFILLHIFLICMTYGNSSTLTINPYKIPNIIYTIYILSKIIILVLIFQIINTLLYFLIKEKLMIVTFIYFIPFYLAIFKNIKKPYIIAPWLHQLIYSWNYFIYDLISFLLCILLFVSIIIILYAIYNRRVK